MNKMVFKTESNKKAADTVNEAGGKAYSLDAENALAQLAVTGTFNNTYYASAGEQLDKFLECAEKCRPEFIAKLAVYAKTESNMKDTPTALLAWLAGKGHTELVKKIFPKIVVNQKMLRNFVQLIRSGKFGRKSFGTSLKNLIKEFLSSKTGDELFSGAVGNNPSLADIVKMIHPTPESKTKEAFYGWLLGNKEVKKRNLPAQIKLFEKFKAGDTSEIPNVDFRVLTGLELSNEQWKAIAVNMPWNALRMNINTLARHNVFDDIHLVNVISEKLASENAVKYSKVFPYQLFTTFQNLEPNIHMAIKLAVQKAAEYATYNIPDFAKDLVVCVDTSGSMESAITGERKGSTSKTTCVEVAALFASSVLRRNGARTTILPFDTSVKHVVLNPLDSLMTNAQKLALHGGGTDCSCALRHLNLNSTKADLVIFISDNESWMNSGRLSYGKSTQMQREWDVFKKNNPKAKLVCIDIQPYTTTQVLGNKDVLNIGGWSDSVFKVIDNFVNNDSRDFAKIIRDVSI